MFWTSSSGRIELQMTMKQARSASHQGRCDEDVLSLSSEKALRRQLDKIDAGTLVDELKEYGAWDDDELADHEHNLQRLVWLAAGDIVEGNN